jgi:WD40 repeat protein
MRTRLRLALLVVCGFLATAGPLGAAEGDEHLFLGNPSGAVAFPAGAKGKDWQVACGGSAWGLAYSPDGKVLALGWIDTKAERGRVALWDTATGRRLALLGEHEGFVGALVFSKDGKHLVAASGAGLGAGRKLARIWDLATRKKHVEFDLDDLPRVLALGGSRRDCLVCSALSGPSSGPFAVWDLASGKRRPLRWKASPDRMQLLALAVSPDGRTLATAQEYGLRLWSLPDAREDSQLRVGRGEQPFTGCLAFSPDGKTLATGHNVWIGYGGFKTRTRLDDPTRVRLWDPATGKVRAALSGHKRGVFAVVFGPDGKTLASLSAEPQAFAPRSECEVKLWDVDARKERFTLAQRQVGRVAGLLFTPAGKHFVTWGEKEPGLKVWRAADGAAAGHLPTGKEAVRYAAFSPDGKQLAAAIQDGTLRQWDFQPKAITSKKDAD